MHGHSAIPLPVARANAPSVVPFLALGVVVLAWLTLVASQLTGVAPLLHHHALIEDGPPAPIALAAFVVGWLVMVVAMMAPASMPTARALWPTLAGRRRPWLATTTFAAAFTGVWVLFGILAFGGDAAIHRVVDATPWLAARPYLIEAGVLALAGTYQWTPLKRRFLLACRHPEDLATTVDPRRAGPGRLGLRHGLDCLGSSWALMLLMFAEGFANLWWMAALTAIMTYETSGRRGTRLATWAGIALVLMGVAALSPSAVAAPAA
jgi:predicted metal-binding membrane protein